MKKNSKKLISVLLALAVVFSFVLAACSKGENNATTAAGDTSAAGETSANTASGEAEYAVILKTLSNDFWATMKKGIEEEAAK